VAAVRRGLFLLLGGLGFVEFEAGVDLVGELFFAGGLGEVEGILGGCYSVFEIGIGGISGG